MFGVSIPLATSPVSKSIGTVVVAGDPLQNMEHHTNVPEGLGNVNAFYFHFDYVCTAISTYAEDIVDSVLTILFAKCFHPYFEF